MDMEELALRYDKYGNPIPKKFQSGMELGGLKREKLY